MKPQSSLPEHPPLSDETAKKQERLFLALADARRLQMLSLLRGGKMSVAQIVARFSLSQPTVSHHLGVLRGAGLVDRQQEGLHTYYTIAANGLTEASTAIRDLVPASGKAGKKSA